MKNAEPAPIVRRGVMTGVSIYRGAASDTEPAQKSKPLSDRRSSASIQPSLGISGFLKTVSAATQSRFFLCLASEVIGGRCAAQLERRQILTRGSATLRQRRNNKQQDSVIAVAIVTRRLLIVGMNIRIACPNNDSWSEP